MNGQFDAPPLIEAAITPRFFHNNSVATLEAAVGFYCSPEFNVNPLAPVIVLNTDKATSISAFLRAGGSTELIDRAIANNNLAMDRIPPLSKPFIKIGLANSRDAKKVLQEGTYLLYPIAQQELMAANALQEKAFNTLNPVLKNAFLTSSNIKLANTRNMIAE